MNAAARTLNEKLIKSYSTDLFLRKSGSPGVWIRELTASSLRSEIRNLHVSAIKINAFA